MERGRGYLGRHWHGELSLGVSFWVNNVLLSVPISMALGALMAWITVTGDLLRSGSLAVLVTWPLLLLFSVWGIVGCWRAARAYLESGGSGLWARLTQLLLLLGALSTGFSAAFDFGPRVPEYLRMARGIDPLGNLRTTLSSDGQRMRLEGPIGAGDAVRVGQQLTSAPALRLIELDSPGGRLKEAEALAVVVRGKGLRTRSTGACESACTLLHMAGSRRQVQPGARLGFHSASSGTRGAWNPVLDRLANRELARIYREAGLPESFIDRTLATPPWGMWYPSRAELAGADLLFVPERPLDLELPPDTSAPAADYAALMEASDTWLALERRQPGISALAAGHMAQARATGADDAAVQLQAQRVIQALLPSLLATAPPPLLESYLALVIDQAASAQAQGGAPACLAVLRADAAVRRTLPATLAQREANWLVDAAAAPAPGLAPRGLSALELEVLRRRLGEQASALLARAWRAGSNAPDPRDPALECRRSIEVLRSAAALPAAERRLAAKVIFQRG
jgi:hypothetical protein